MTEKGVSFNEREEESKKATHGPWLVPLRFGVHAVIATAVFLIIAAPALFLDFLVQYLETQDASKHILSGLTLAEVSIFLVDLILLLRYLWSEAARAWDEL